MLGPWPQRQVTSEQQVVASVAMGPVHSWHQLSRISAVAVDYLGKGRQYQLCTAAVCSVQAPTCGSHLHMRVAAGSAVGLSSVQHLVPLMLHEKNPRKVLVVCVCECMYWLVVSHSAQEGLWFWYHHPL